MCLEAEEGITSPGTGVNGRLRAAVWVLGALEEQLVLSPHAVWLLAYDARFPDTQYHMLDSHVFVREGDLNSDVCCIYCFFGCDGGGGGGVISVKKKQGSLVGNYF